MKIVPFSKEHIAEVIFKELPDTKEARDLVASNAEKSISFTVLDNQDRVLCITGLCQIWGSVYEIWAFTTPLFYKSLKVIVVAFNQLYSQMENIPYQRIQADVRADLSQNLSFIKHFGFKEEAVFQNYGLNGETYIRFVKFGD